MKFMNFDKSLALFVAVTYQPGYHFPTINFRGVKHLLS